MKCLVKYMHHSDVSVEASWAPSYDKNETILLGVYTIKVLKNYNHDETFKYLIKIINLDIAIPNIIADEDALIEQDITLIQLISNLISNKRFEVKFTRDIIDAIYRK